MIAEQWTRIRSRLQSEVGEVEYRMWLRQMTLGDLDGDRIRVHLPTRFLRDWVREHYGDRLHKHWQAENQAIRQVEISVGGADTTPMRATSLPPATAPEPLAAAIAHPANAHPAIAHPATGRALAPGGRAIPEPEATAEPALNAMGRSVDGLNLEPRFTFDSFIVGKPNEFAYACARRVAEQPGNPGFNPLFLYGGVGLGKTHLMHAIAADIVTRNPGRPNGPITVAYMSAERFMYRFIGALRSNSTMEFKGELSSVDVLMIDDLQFLIGKDNTQEEFFHTFNALIDAGRQIVVSADKSPSDLSGLEDRLRTRLGCGMVADVHATTFELRISILEAKAAWAGITVPRKVLEFLAHKITSNVRELEGALNRIVAHSKLFDLPVTLESAQERLHDLLRVQERRITIDEIQRTVASHFSIRLADMGSARRARAVARPRQVAMYLAKHLTQRSLPEIGRKFGNRDHTTVIHAVERVTKLMAEDPAFAEDVELLRKRLETQ